MTTKSYFEKDKFEIWTKDKLEIGSIGKHGDMKFKVLDCIYLVKQKCYAVLCLWLKKIAFLTPTYNYYSGVDRVAQEKVTKATEIGHDCTIITMEAQIKNNTKK